METAQAFIIVITFLVKCAGFATFVIGLVTVWNWLRKNVSFFTFTEEEETENTDWVKEMYR
jgi:hypothetical protein